ncbi:FLUCTUATING-LIGHT-ACCLIMATION protein 1, chloroplastic-like [Carex rostrata]
MVVPSWMHTLATKSMALGLLLTIMTSFPHDAVAASGGAMGGGFSSRGVSRSSSGSGYRSRDPYSRDHYSTYVYREYRGGCCGYRQNYTPPRQNGMHEKYMEGFIYASIAFGVIFVLAFIALTYFDKIGTKTSVVKLQVALKGTACSLQRDLNHIALKADTSTQEGYKYILEESAKALLRHSEFWLLSYLSENTRSDEHQAERLFYDLSFQERSKFDEETLVNVDNHQEQKSTLEIVSTSASPFIVVNLLVAVTRQLKLSPIHSVSDLKDVLKELGGLPKSEILAAHVLWTPQDENDYLSPERLLQDYPNLMDLRSKLD